MKKSKILFMALMLILSLNVTNIIIATEQDNTVQTEEQSDPEKEKIIQLINDYLAEIEGKIKNIDIKIENIRLQDEFAYYPAVRLNVDSPILGMNSVLENRLRVKRDISTSDVAAKYSIRDILSNKQIKLPESYLGSIVVSTIDVDINSTMNLPQAKLTLVKCIQYLSQVNNASEFVDNQTNKIFKDYIPEQKKASIKDIKNRTAKVENELEVIADQIMIQAFLGKDVKSYNEQYLTLSEELYNVSEMAKNQLMLDEDITELTKRTLTLETNLLDLKDTVKKSYDDSLLTMNYGTFLDSIQKDYESRVNVLDKYVEASVTEVESLPEDEKESTENKEDTIEIKTETNYEVTSKATIDYIKIALSDIETLQEENENQMKQDVIDLENLSEEEKSKLIEENEIKIMEVYNKYKDVLSREYKFYTDNINMLLDDSNDKISSIISEIDTGIEIDDMIFDYTKYIYLDLPNNLTEYLNKNNLDSIIELDNLIKLLRKELGVLSNNDVEITDMYNDMINKMLES